MDQIFGQRFIIFHFIEYCLDQLKNKHKKAAVNSAIQFFESRYQKKYLEKIWPSFLTHPPQNGDPTETIF